MEMIRVSKANTNRIKYSAFPYMQCMPNEDRIHKQIDQL